MSRKTIYEGRKITLVLESLSLPDGTSVEKEIVLHPGAAVMIPFVDAERICVVRNHRVSVKETLLELPAGTLDPGETAEKAALREIEEETGYRAGRCRKIAEFYPSPGFLTELMHLFVLEDLSPGEMNLDPGEQVQPVILPWSEAVQMALDGRIRDGKTLAGLLLWDRIRP
jgi:ADP-ribose pyrophosphatase